MRAIRPIAYMIYSLEVVFRDMTNFLFVFLIMIIAYASAFNILRTNYPPNTLFQDDNMVGAMKYSFDMAIGGVDTSDFDDYTYFVYIGASILQVIIMLNLLIAIISNSFAVVEENSTVFTYI